ncbi:MAG: DUF4258 domain-containing protein [Candidatus Bathyarchaeia archaeon]
MSFQFSRHALEKARKRGISMSKIYQALEDPDELYEDIEHKTKIAIKKTNSKLVILAYTKEKETVKVITVYYTKLDKLLKSKTERGAWKRIK